MAACSLALLGDGLPCPGVSSLLDGCLSLFNCGFLEFLPPFPTSVHLLHLSIRNLCSLPCCSGGCLRRHVCECWPPWCTGQRALGFGNCLCSCLVFWLLMQLLMSYDQSSWIQLYLQLWLYIRVELTVLPSEQGSLPYACSIFTTLWWES